MALRSLGYGLSNSKGATVTVQGVTTLAPGSNATVVNSGTGTDARLTFGIPAGSTGATPAFSIGTVTTLAAGANATASIGGTAAAPALNLGIPAGTSGSNATATPLGTVTPLANGTAAPGASGNAAREDHVHPLTAGRTVFLGNLNVSETLLVSLSLGMKRKTFALAGVGATDTLAVFPTGAPTTGCEVVNAYPAGAGNVSIGYYTPALGIAAAYSIPISVYRIV